MRSLNTHTRDIADGRYHGAGDERADARNGHQLAATLTAMCQNLYLFGDVFDALIKTAPIAAEVFAVCHVSEMLSAFKANYYAAWHGEKQRDTP